MWYLENERVGITKYQIDIVNVIQCLPMLKIHKYKPIGICELN